MIRGGRQLPLYLSAPHRCSYLADRASGTLFTDPDGPMDMPTYSELLRFGFRRSGRMVYAPRCEDCRQCVSVRLPVDDFAPRRNHRRIERANAGVELVERPAAFDPEHYALYRRYTAARHEDGDMAGASAEEYMGFLSAAWCETRFFELREHGQLLGVAATDLAQDGLSAVYTFFDPDQAGRSLGTLAILRQIAACRRRGLPYLYLGYWIRESRKMSYKARFRPIELWRDGAWRRYTAADPLPD